MSKKYSNYGGSAFRPSDLCYDKLVGHYIKKFGKSNVQVLPYEMLNDNSELFFEEIFSLLKKEKPELNLSSYKKANVTKSKYLRFKLRHLFRLFNPYDDVDKIFPNKFLFSLLGQLSNSITTILPKSLETRFQIKIEKYIYNYSLEKFGKSNKKLQELTGINLGKYGYDL